MEVFNTVHSFAIGYYEGRTLHEQISVTNPDIDRMMYLSGFEYGTRDFTKFDADQK